MFDKRRWSSNKCVRYLHSDSQAQQTALSMYILYIALGTTEQLNNWCTWQNVIITKNLSFSGPQLEKEAVSRHTAVMQFS